MNAKTLTPVITMAGTVFNSLATMASPVSMTPATA